MAEVVSSGYAYQPAKKPDMTMLDVAASAMALILMSVCAGQTMTTGTGTMMVAYDTTASPLVKKHRRGGAARGSARGS